MLRFLCIACFFLSGCIGIWSPGVQGSQGIVAINTDRRVPSAVLIDTALEYDLNNKIQELPLAQDSRVYVKSFNQHIIVLGQAPYIDELDELSDILSKTQGVRRVYNEVSSAEPISKWQRLHDRVITTKIQANMFLAPQVKPWRMQVFTENGVVYLVGIVRPAEEDLAVEIASSVDGVQKVVKILEQCPAE